MPDDAKAAPRRSSAARVLAVLGAVAAWVWTIVAGGGGVGLLILRGPWRLTHGWFALCSGLAACPLTAILLRKYARIRVPGWVRLAAAVLFVVAGRIALRLGL